MGFHTRGEMGGIWSPPIKLLDGIWFGIGDHWIGPATEFTSGYGHVEMDLPDRGGLSVSRTDFVPDGHRAALFGLTSRLAGRPELHPEDGRPLRADGRLPVGRDEAEPAGLQPEDKVSVEEENLVFREQGTPPAQNAVPHDWAAVVGSNLDPTGSETGEEYRGPQDPAEVIVRLRSHRRGPRPLRRHRLREGQRRPTPLRRERPGGQDRTVWFAVAGADSDGEDPADAKAAALEENAAVLEDPEALLREKVSVRLKLAGVHALTCPATADRGEHRLEQAEPRRLRAGGRGPRGPRDERRHELPGARGTSWPGYAFWGLASPTTSGSSAPTASTPPSPASPPGSSSP